MSILTGLLNTGKRIKNKLSFNHKRAVEHQARSLNKLLTTAKDTQYGKTYEFNHILTAHNPYTAFQKTPINNYSTMYKWWKHAKEGGEDITWPGKVEYFALSSGTSEGASKYIPITKSMLRSIKRASLRQILYIARSDLPKDYLAKDYLMIGGSTDLHFDGTTYSGDLSGITTSNLPGWFERFSKPEEPIKREHNWQNKIEYITNNAKNWDVAMIAGVPAWIQLLFENIIKKYNVETIHDIWPNLTVYIHGGVSFEPYKKRFSKLLGKPLMYFETYLASEGFIAFQTREDSEGMRLITRNGIFFEFIPFNEDNFTIDGELKQNPEVLNLAEVEEGKEYALLISTCAGAWRYMIGDTVKFTSVDRCEIKITGRTKHFISMVGEHLSVDNMNRALEMVANELNTTFTEFTVSGIPHQGFFAHQWYIGYENGVNLDPEVVKQKLDDALKELNDDYKVERLSALKDVFVKLIPTESFINWMEYKGKLGAQNKFPRVMKKDQHEEWKEFLENEQAGELKQLS